MLELYIYIKKFRRCRILKIRCKLLGVPKIIKDKEEVLFSYAKINAFFYYMLIEKTVPRNTIAELLWPEDSEKTARKNLRNVLYHTKKNIHPDIILSPNNRILQLNQDMDIYIDVEDFINNPEDNLDLYEGEFLKGFYIKDLDDFDRWLNTSRSYYHQTYYSNLYERIDKNIKDGIFDNGERAIQELISMDNLDEKNYRLLMTYYHKIGRSGRAIEIYGELGQLLRRELMVDPDSETQRLYREILESFSPTAEELDAEVFYFGREREIIEILNTVNDFLRGKNINTIFIDGEIGVGKSTLVNRVFFDLRKQFKIYSLRCFQIERTKPYRTMEVLLNKLEKDKEPGDFYGQIQKLLKEIKEIQGLHRFEEKNRFLEEELEDRLVEFFSELGKLESLLIHIEDVHWMDLESLRLLTKILLRTEDLLFFLSGRKIGNADIDSFISTLYYYDKVKKIALDRFSREETFRYLEKTLPEIDEPAIYEEIYEKSEGLPIFIWEYVKLLKAKKPLNKMTVEMENTIKAGLFFLDEEDREKLEVLSLFTIGFSETMVFQLFDTEDRAIVKFLDKMIKYGVLEEYRYKNQDAFRFTHKKIREFLYSTNSKSKRKYYHGLIGKILERTEVDEEGRLEHYEKLAYHFRKAEKYVEELEYNIEILNYYLNFSHELFPVLGTNENLYYKKMYVSRGEVQKMFAMRREELERAKRENYSDKLEYLVLKLNYMRGRYLIRDGDYKNGLEDIKFVIRKSQEMGEKDYEINGYRQMIFYNIQRNNPDRMIYYIDKALELAVECNYHMEIGVFLRLKGLYYLMIGDYESSERILQGSINSFIITESVADIYAINIAAANNYLGELKFAQKEYEKAIGEFEKSIELSKGKGVFSSMSVFYINLGKAYFAKKDLKNARKYFNLALELNQNIDSFWKRTVLDSYMALTEFLQKDYEKSREYLKIAIKYSKKMDDPRDIGTVNFAMYLISREMGDSIIEKYFKGIIGEGTEHYRNLALEYLDANRDTYEVDILQK